MPAGKPVSFKTRIPVPRGAHIGLSGDAGAAVCKDAVGHVALLASGPWALNERRPLAVSADVGVPVEVTVEADRDGDGYGDYTQDRCPAGKKTQEECPKVHLRIGDTRVTPRTIYVEVRATSATKLDVYGQVGWKLRQENGKKVGIIQGIGARHSRQVRGGKTYTVPVPLEPTILRRLSRIPPSQFLIAKMTAVSVDIADRVVAARFRVRLPGQG